MPSSCSASPGISRRSGCSFYLAIPPELFDDVIEGLAGSA
jgi:glucose-6-phosphate 1-dehydrogenase